MTTELEKQFFSTFGIEPKTIIEPRYSLNAEYYEEKVEKYPQINDRILLELICIDYTENSYKCRGYASNAEELKNYLLGQFIHEFENDLYRDKEDIKQQVQALFKE